MENVYVVDIESLKAKIRQFTKGNFHVIADFDQTLTKAFIDGQKAHTTIAQIREGKYLTKDYPEKAHALFDKYHPIEVSHDISDEEKDKKMLEWWRTHLELMIKSGMNKNVINDIVKSKRLTGRDKLPEFLKLLSKNNIPMLVLSAGYGDIIKGYLEFNNLLSNNMHIISNFLILQVLAMQLDTNLRLCIHAIKMRL